MTVTIVVRTRNEGPRLRLTLASLRNQSVPAPVVVVDDGSDDETPAILAAAGGVTVVRHAVSQGASAASNSGARAATGDILLFLDGDTLAHPDLVARHTAAHAGNPGLCGRGETFHLRQTRAFQDPETGTPRPGQAARVAAMTPAELRSRCVTLAQVTDDFGAIDRRASPAIYPGAGPRALYELEMAALRDAPGCSVLWAAASGANLSVSRRAFLDAGGFDPALRVNEHRELALRLVQRGARMGAVPGARTYHLTHRDGWSGHDPLQDPSWEEPFYRRHPIPAVKLLAVLWASLSDPCPLPAEARLLSLPALEQAAAHGADYAAARRILFGHFA